MSDFEKRSNHVFCDHEEKCLCVHCYGCQNGHCWHRCCAKWMRERARDAAARNAKAKSLIDQHRQRELPPDQVEWLEAEGWGVLVAKISKQRKESAHKQKRRPAV